MTVRPLTLLFIAWLECYTSPSTETDQGAEFPSEEGSEAPLRGDSKMHLFKLLGPDRTRASELSALPSTGKWLGTLWLGLLWTRKGSRTPAGAGVLFLICRLGGGALCPPPTPACHLIPSWIV